MKMKCEREVVCLAVSNFQTGEMTRIGNQNHQPKFNANITVLSFRFELGECVSALEIMR